ncbi:MAG: PEP-CTERM sorting domain-containing protein [Verrucomicrobiota bacterium]
MTRTGRTAVWRVVAAMAAAAVMTWMGAKPALGAIVIDGNPVGTSFVLTSTATHVSISAGMLTIGNNGNISGSLMISAGDVVINSGNIAAISMSAGNLTLDGANVNLQSGITASGGVVQLLNISNANGPFTFLGGVQAVLADGNMNGVVSVEENAEVHFVSPFFTNANTNASSLVLDAAGSISGNGSNLTFAVTDQAAELYVGGGAPVFVPEPSGAMMVLLGLATVIGYRRRRP